MAVVKPFPALRPARDLAGQVSSPPFDAANREPALLEVQHNERSYLHVVKPFLNFPGEKKDPAKHFPIGLEYLRKFLREGWLIRDKQPCFYIYRMIKGHQSYSGIIASASIDDYKENRILRHENTLTEKQAEIAEHIRYYNSLGSPILLTYPDDLGIDQLIDQYIHQHVPEYNFISRDQVKHNLWVVTDPKDLVILEDRFEALGNLYIADGHHRTAGAAAFCELKREENPEFTGEEAFNYFPVCLIPFSKLTIFEYHRLVKDSKRVLAPDFLNCIRNYFEVTPSGHLPVQPLEKGEFGIYFNKQAFLLKLKPHWKNQLEGTLNRLDVSIVEEFILNRVFEISNSKTDHRLSFMDGGKGIGHLQELVDSGNFDLAITLFPTHIDEIKSVAEQNLIMPPKSTWIEPKFRSGLIILEYGSH